MILSRLPAVAALFGGNRAAVRGAWRRWAKARAAAPEIAEDLIRLGGVLAGQPVRFQGGLPELEPIDPHRLAYEAGRRDLAVQLLALMQLSPAELNSLMEVSDAD